jgi:hypothetical protein
MGSIDEEAVTVHLCRIERHVSQHSPIACDRSTDLWGGRSTTETLTPQLGDSSVSYLDVVAASLVRFATAAGCSTTTGPADALMALFGTKTPLSEELLAAL